MIVLKAIGYWKSDNYPELPDPEFLVEEDFTISANKAICEYLENSIEIAHYRGFSFCRFDCKIIPPGVSDNTDGEFIFPSGLIHYVRDHKVQLPDEFVQKAIRYAAVPSSFLLDPVIQSIIQGAEKYEIDFEWWINACSQMLDMK